MAGEYTLYATIVPELASNFRQQTERLINTALKGINPTVTIDVEVSGDVSRKIDRALGDTRKTIHVNVDVDKGLGLATKGLGGLVGGFEAATQTAGAAAKGLGALSNLAGAGTSTIAGMASTVSNASIVMGNLSAGVSKAAADTAGATVGAAAYTAAAIEETVATGGLNIAIGILAVTILGVVAAMGSFVAISAAMTAAAVVAGAVMTALATAASVAGGAIAALPAAIGAATGGLAVLAAVFIPVMQAFQDVIGDTNEAGGAAKEYGNTQINAARSIRSAAEAIVAAQDRQKEAQQGLLESQKDLTEARRTASQQLRDMKDEIQGLSLTEEAAEIRLIHARERLDVVNNNRKASDLDRREALLAVNQAEHDQGRLIKDNIKKVAAYNDARKKGVKGSDVVVSAQEKVVDSQKRLADAQKSVALAQRSHSEAIVDAGRKMATTSASIGKVSKSLAMLSSAGLIFVGALKSLKDAFVPISKALQETVLPSFTRLVNIGKDLLPVFLPALQKVGGAISTVVGAFGNLLKDNAFLTDLKTLLGVGANFIKSFGTAGVSLIKDLISGLAILGRSAQPVVTALSEGIKEMGPSLKLFFEAFANADVMKGLAAGLDGFFDLVNGLMPLIGGFLGELSKVGGPILQQLTGPLLSIFKSLFTMLSQLATGGLLTGFVVFIQAIATAFTTLVNSGVMTTLSKAFGDILIALAPVVVDLVDRLAPLLPTIVTAFGDLTVAFLEMLPSLMPLIPPILKLVTMFIEEMVPNLPILVGLLVALIGPLPILAAAFLALGTGTLWTWNHIIKPVFNFLKTFIMETIPKAFNTGIGYIKTAWDKLKEIAKVPVNFVIGTVYNKGIVPMWNWVAEKVGLDKLEPMAELARGGRIPGRPSSRDNLLASSSFGPVALATGEYVVNARATKENLSLLEYINAGKMPGYAEGGLFGKIKNVFNRGKNAVRGGLANIVEQMISPIRNTLDSNSSLNTGFGPWVKAIPMTILSKILSWVRGDDKKNAVSVNFGDWPSGPGAQRGDSGVWRKVVAIIKAGPQQGLFGNAYRPGDPLWHGSGRAVDWMGYNMDALANYLAAKKPLELIHRTNTRDYAYTRGQDYGSFNEGTMNAHRNHIHIAFDEGGWLKPGQRGVNHLNKPEAVLTPSQSKGLVSMAQRSNLSGNGMRVTLSFEEKQELARLMAQAVSVRPHISTLDGEVVTEKVSDRLARDIRIPGVS